MIPRIEPFIAAPARDMRPLAIDAFITRSSVLRVQAGVLVELLNERPSEIALVVPAAEAMVELHLSRVEICSSGFSISTASGSYVAGRVEGLHYQGMVAGDPSTLAAISIFEDEVMGFVSDAEGNHILGKLADGSGEHIYYAERDRLDPPAFDCGTPQDDRSYDPEDLVFESGSRSLNCVDLFWEVNYEIFLDKGGLTGASNYVTGLFNMHAALFANDGISVRLSELIIWDVPSPYTSTDKSVLLDQFQDHRNTFNGDLAHLIGYGGGGGVAASTIGLCSPNADYSMCYSGVSWMYNPIPIYSWSVNVVTHEEGHLLGSQHTHACVWNGNSTAIDGCGPAAGYSEGTCAEGPLPSATVGGTIMSYCHIIGNVGVNFANGFGPQPAAVILNNVNNAPCVGACTACGDPLGLMAVNVTGTNATLSWSPVSGAGAYDLQWKPSSSGTWSTITAIAGNSRELTGLIPGTDYDYRVRAVCAGGSSAYSATISFHAPACQPGATCDDGNPNTGPDLWNGACACVSLPADPMEIDKVVALDRGAGDNFGYDVAISGDYAIAGAWFEDENASGGVTLNNAGSAYIYHWTGSQWSQEQKIVASDRGANDWFGHSVAMDGDYAVVGAYQDGQGAGGGPNVTQAGSAYIFMRTGTTWVQQQKIVASDRAVLDQFGASVAIDGNYVVVGALNEDEDALGLNTATSAGAAYIFVRSGSTWTQQQKIVASDRAALDVFGADVGISGDHIIAGALNEDEDANGGSTLSTAGSAYIFQRNGSTWTQQQKIVASDRSTQDQFGWSVAIDGDYAVVGAVYEDHDANGGAVTQNAGSAYIFKRDAGQWSQQQKIVASDRGVNDWVGYSVAISGDRVLVGAPHEDHDLIGVNALDTAGSAYVFRRVGNAWGQLEKVVADDRASGDRFGYSVSLSGVHAVVGAPYEDHDTFGMNPLSAAGSAYFIADPTRVSVQARIMLAGPFAAAQMSDDLRVLGLIPGGEPYSAMGYDHIGAGGGESVQPYLLGTSGSDAITDWVVVEVRGSTFPHPVLATRSALVQRDGDVIATDGANAVSLTIGPGLYHVSIRHRNHLGVMTASPIALSSTPTAIDFTNPATPTYGSNAQANSNGTMVLWPGNTNFDNQVKYVGSANDRDPILLAVGSTTPNNTLPNVYDRRDTNLDGVIKYTGSANDRDIILNNVGSTTPNNTRTQQLP